MAKRLIDGVEFIVPDILGDIDDVVSGQDEFTEDHQNYEEFQQADALYQEENIIGLLAHIDGHQALQRKADGEAADAIEREIAYFGTDAEKIQKLRQQRLLATHCANWIRQTVVNAAQVPQPTLHERATE